MIYPFPNCWWLHRVLRFSCLPEPLGGKPANLILIGSLCLVKRVPPGMSQTSARKSPDWSCLGSTGTRLLQNAKKASRMVLAGTSPATEIKRNRPPAEDAGGRVKDVRNHTFAFRNLLHSPCASPSIDRGVLYVDCLIFNALDTQCHWLVRQLYPSALSGRGALEVRPAVESRLTGIS